jgi:hypothetical protein
MTTELFFLLTGILFLVALVGGYMLGSLFRSR